MIRWLLGLIGLPILLLVVLLVAMTDSRPSLSRSVQVGMADLDRGKAIFDSLGLRRMKEGEVRQLVLTEAELDKGVNYLAHRLAGGSASARIALSQLIVRASLPLPLLPRFINLELALASGNEVLQPAQLRLGKLKLPAALSGKLVLWGLAGSPYGEELAAARSLLDSAQLVGQNLALRFTWRGAAVQKMMTGGAGEGSDEASLKPYRDHLGQVRGSDFPLLMGEMMALAQTRSRSGDPVAENRAALTVLAEKAMGSRLLSKQGIARTDRRTSLKLAGRNDFAQHFALSAFLAATGGKGLSNMAGLYKELKDAQGGSGFSFNDLAADRAGAYFGQFCTQSGRSARHVQATLAQTREATLFFPVVKDLPEFLPQVEFQRRFGGVGQPAYQRMIEKIDARISALPLYTE